MRNKLIFSIALTLLCLSGFAKVGFANGTYCSNCDKTDPGCSEICIPDPLIPSTGNPATTKEE